MKYLLDTNVCIRYLNGTSEMIRQNLEFHDPYDIAVCSVVKSELYYGAYKSRYLNKTLEKINFFFDQFQSLFFDDKSAETYGGIRSSLEKIGKIIGPYDLQIASIAIANDLVLVTHNTGEFGRMPELRIEDWEKK